MSGEDKTSFLFAGGFLFMGLSVIVLTLFGVPPGCQEAAPVPEDIGIIEPYQRELWQMEVGEKAWGWIHPCVDNDRRIWINRYSDTHKEQSLFYTCRVERKTDGFYLGLDSCKSRLKGEPNNRSCKGYVIPVKGFLQGE